MDYSSNCAKINLNGEFMYPEILKRMIFLKTERRMSMKNVKINAMKRVMAALLALLLLLTLTACGGKEKEEVSQDETSVSQAEATATPPPTTVKVKIATVDEISGKLNIRSEPNTDCEILETALAGDRFEVLTENCQVGWHEIAYKGGKAYISSDFVTVAEELQAAPTPTPEKRLLLIFSRKRFIPLPALFSRASPIKFIPTMKIPTPARSQIRLATSCITFSADNIRSPITFIICFVLS